MTIARVSDHVESGLGLLIEQYKNKPRIAALIASELNQIQDLEDAIWDVLISRLLDTATDAQLVTLGSIVGQDPIDGEDDDLFRLRIYTRIRANRSNGHPDDVIAVCLLALEGVATDWTYDDIYPASFIVEVMEPISTQMAILVAEFMRAAKAPGVGGSLHYSDEDEADTFAFATGDTWEDDAARGMSGDDIDGAGGSWIGTA